MIKRVLWTVGLGLCGLYLGGKGNGLLGIGLGSLWFAGIGYGIGSIFDQKRPTKLLVIYWAATLALAAPFWALPVAALILPDLPNLPFRQQATAGAIGALIGALLGVLFGTIHLRRLRQRSISSVSNGSRLTPLQSQDERR
jgi:hypothetical protein